MSDDNPRIIRPKWNYNKRFDNAANVQALIKCGLLVKKRRKGTKNGKHK